MPIIAKKQERSERDERLYRIRHSFAHLMAEAVQSLWPGTRLAFGPPIEDGFYYDFLIDHRFSEDDLKKIEDKMKELRKKNAAFVCEPVAKDEALRLFNGMGEYLKAEHVETLPPDAITLYRDGDFVDLCAGPHVESTGELKHFKLLTASGSYWRGDEKRESLQRIYGTAWDTQDELKDYLRRLEEAKKRDHRVLGKELRLFEFPELAGPGLPFYLPHGATILQELKDWMWDLHVSGDYGHRDKGYEPLATPHILKTDAWHTSGHIQNYRENMFMVYSLDELDQGLIGPRDSAKSGQQAVGCCEPDGEGADIANGSFEASNGERPGELSSPQREAGEGLGNYGLKPMNCPGHILMYKVGTKSYRDLPVRYFEFGTVYRYERAGTLHGMLRVRSFTQDDAHIFCTQEQYAEEVEAVFDFCCHILDTFGFEYMIGFKTRGEKRVGSDAVWDMAENGLRAVLEKRAAGKYYVQEGDATFYGPKVDFIIRDSLGREWQGSTIQLDFNLPERFELEYVGDDGQNHRPVMIHRAILGSFERFFGLLIEEFGGAYPLWLAPVQLRILPVGEAQLDYAKKLAGELACMVAGKIGGGYRLRVEVDSSSETLGKKIRSGKTSKVPFLVVVGGREAEEGTVSVEGYHEGKLPELTSVDALASKLAEEIKSKIARRRE
ncbi:MAG: threonine--tRNA ligase [bacterium]|nr:threonine--tRNA ligase [bacterium]